MFTLSLVTPEKKVVTDVDVDEVIVPAHRGELDILPGHAPLMTTLRVGILRYRLKGQSNFESVAISWGYCQVNPQGVNVLAETAETKEEIDKERAEAALKEAQKQLLEPDVEPDQIRKFQRRMERAKARLDLANR